jgi:hypothetical protein
MTTGSTKTRISAFTVFGPPKDFTLIPAMEIPSLSIISVALLFAIPWEIPAETKLIFQQNTLPGKAGCFGNLCVFRG